MDVPAAVLSSLKCSRCEEYLSRAPVFLQHDGAAMCGCCFDPKRPATRMRHYETVAKLLRFPCRNKDLGCPVTVPFVAEGQVIDHDEECEHRQYMCPLLDSTRCDWLGTRAGILQHCSSQHPDLVFQNPITIRHDITRASTSTYLLTAFQVLFLLYTKVCLASGRIYHTVLHLGTFEEVVKYKYNLDIKRSDIRICKSGDVEHEGCLAMQEPTSLAVNTKSLLDVLGGFDGTTYTVTVKRRVTCARCGEVMPGLLYRDEAGWRCELCAPVKRACKNLTQGCTHTDIDFKYWKHEWFFCQQGTKCEICKKVVSRGSLSTHYDSVHKDVTYRAGSMLRADLHIFPILKHCLVSTIAGTAMCEYWLDDLRFVLSVYIPLPTERLSEFRCTVRLTHRYTGHTGTYTPDACYTDSSDWRIVLKRGEFPLCHGEFDVCVDIAKVGTD